MARITIIPQESNIIPNYSDPYVCANFLGYQRDEIYRFGIIFYNNKNIPSPVHWIGDIKMPASYMSTNSFSELYPFHCGRYINTNEEANHKEMTAFVLGIEFKIKNVPDEVYAYEIVRCDRTQSDRTVVCQGALGATMAYTHADEYSYNYGDVDTRPMPALMLPKRGYYMLGDWDGKYHLKQEQVRSDCFEFASPEICISG